MIIGGLWHGPTLNFLKWGALNGIGLVVYKNWKRISPYEKSNALLAHFWKVFITFNFITFTRIFFVVQDPEKSQQVMDQIFYNGNYSNIGNTFSAYWIVFAVLAVAFLIHWLPVKIKDAYTGAYTNLSPVLQAIVIIIMVIFIYQWVSEVRVPFTYTQM